MSIREALEAAGAEMGLPNGIPADSEEEGKSPELDTLGEDPEIDSDNTEDGSADGATPEEAQQSKSPKADEETKPSADKTGEQQPPETQKEVVEPPQFWKAEHKTFWGEVPVKAQKAIIDYENQRNAWANRIANEVAQVRSNQKQLDSVVEPHVPRLKASGLQPVEAIDKLLRWSDALDDDNSRIPAFNRLLASYGLTPEHLMGQETENVDPVYSQLNTQLSDLTKWKEDLVRQQIEFTEQQEQQQLQGEINSVKTEKDNKGNLKFPKFDFYQAAMAQVIPNIRAANPHLHAGDVIRIAYSEIAKQDPAAQVVQAPQQPQLQAEKQRVDRAQRAAKMNVNSRPTSEVPSRPKNAREALMDSAAELGIL